MTNGERIRQQILQEFAAWEPRLDDGTVSSIEICIRPYRKDGTEVSSTGRRESQHLRLAKDSYVLK